MSAEAINNAIEGIAARLDGDARVVVLSGAGMSAESGIPTFRDALTGLWEQYRPEDLATPEAFAKDPTRVWRWYEHRRAGVRAAEPHAGHHALVEFEKHVGRLTIVTQNVDGLHQRSGSTRVLELHGNILRSVCSVSRRVIGKEWIEDCDEAPPPSPYVKGALARPDVVWFGESLPEAVFVEAVGELQNCTVCLAVGTSALVYPAAGLPQVAKDAGALLVEINPQPTPLTPHVDHALLDKAGPALARILSAL